MPGPVARTHLPKPMRTPRVGLTARGMSLLEVVIVVTIVAVLVGVLGPALMNAKRSGYVASDISNLRQIAAAALSYSEETGVHPRGVQPLVARGLLPKGLTLSGLDGSRRGIANEIVAAIARDSPMYTRMVTPYRRSYVSLYDMFFPIAAVEGPNGEAASAGWLVSMSEGAPMQSLGKPEWKIWTGRYRRLRFDGSVSVRMHRWAPNEKGGRYYSALMWFSDDDRAWKEWIKSIGPSL